MNRETMLAAKHSVGTPRTSAATYVRKRNRTPSDCNLCEIDSEAFQLNELVVPKLTPNEIPLRSGSARSFSDKGPIVLPSPQQVGVFGVDANKRINMWNDSAAAVTGALSSKSASNSNEEENDGIDDDNEGDVFGMPFDDVFPSSSFEVAGTGSSTSLPATISLIDVLDKVFQTGEPSMSVSVTAKCGRKRGRDEITNETNFSVDLLPQFDSGPAPAPPVSSDNNIKRSCTGVVNTATSTRTVTGVILLCKSEKRYHRIFKTDCDDANPSSAPTLIDIARSIAMPPAIDKPRSVSAGSSETFSTEAETELDNSSHTNHKPSESSITEEIENNQLFHHLPSPPMSSVKAAVVATKQKSRCSSSDEDYRALFETMDAVIFGVDQSGNINEWNHQMEELTGISKGVALGRSLVEDTSLHIFPCENDACNTQNGQMTFQDVIEPLLSKTYKGLPTPQLRLKIKAKATNAPEPKVSISSTEAGQETILGKNEKDRVEESLIIGSISPRYNVQQKVVGAIFMGCDMTEGLMKFRAIRTGAHELRKLIDTANVPIFGIDVNGYVNEWNNKTSEITGYEKDDAFGCLLVDTFIFPDIRDSVREILHNALKHGKGTSNYELEFRTKFNEIRHLLVNITPQYDMNNNVVGVVLIAQDVTEAVNRDRAVASMALELRQLIDTANAPIFGINVHGKVNEWNTRMSTITGYTKEEAVDKPLVENFIASSMKEKVGEILEAALHGNETSNYEVEVISKSGEPIVLLVNATTRKDPDSNVIGVVGVAQDVTEDRKHSKALRAMQTLRASQEAKVETERNMTAYFAHELRNPLGAIDSALAAMPDGLPDNAQTLVNGMQLCTKFMSSIMNNLLDVRKMEEGTIRLGRKPVSIRKLLDNVHEMLLPSVRPGVDFEKLINVNAEEWVLGDSHRIEQVFTNVISNAIKYTVSGHIQISIEWENERLKFICKDTGPGIPKSEQSKLFQRFVQRGGAPGTGLGLAIAKHIVDLTGGSIRFESDPSVRLGTTCIVYMTLPLCNAPDTPVKKKTEFIKEPLSVLVIDDIKMNRTMVKKRILKRIAPNAKIQEAATGEEALLICGKDKFDVMIVDQYMEGAGGVMVGTEVVFAMRRMRIDSVLIGCSGNDIGAQFFEAGADMVWQKPMPSNDQIIRDLRSCLDKRKVASF